MAYQRKNVGLIKEIKDKYNLKIVSIIPDTFTQAKYGNGSFSSNDPKIRKRAMEEVKNIWILHLN